MTEEILDYLREARAAFRDRDEAAWDRIANDWPFDTEAPHEYWLSQVEQVATEAGLIELAARIARDCGVESSVLDWTALRTAFYGAMTTGELTIEGFGTLIRQDRLPHFTPAEGILGHELDHQAIPEPLRQAVIRIVNELKAGRAVEVPRVGRFETYSTRDSVKVFLIPAEDFLRQADIFRKRR